jgi:hypothetical protein
MDQVRNVLFAVGRYSFWIFCGLITVIAVSTAVMNARAMSAARDKAEKELDSDLAKIDRVKNTVAEVAADGVKAHPNQTTIDGMAEQIQVASAEALAAWEARYKSQAPAFVWPKDLLGPATATFERQPPPERFLPTGRLVNPGDAVVAAPPAPAAGTDEDGAVANPSALSENAPEELTTINTQELQKFADVIALRMPQIANIIGATWAFGEDAEEKAAVIEESAGEFGSGGAGVRRGGSRDRTDEKTDGIKIDRMVVDWRKRDQDRWNTLVTEFRTVSRLPSNRPTLPMALYIQQDLWLLEALFNVIKEVNGDADSVETADIKKIDHIFFGKDALGMSGTVTAPNPRILKLAVDQGYRKELPPPKASTGKPSMANTKFIFKSDTRDFLEGRYVDGHFQPLAANVVRSAINSDQLSANPELIVAKRIPFRIAFEMDERKIPEFLAACANSPFRFEVRQIRINRHSPGQMASIEGRAETGPGDGGANAAGDAGGGAAAGGFRGGAGEEDLTASRTNYTIRVEFYGIVKVYNPVNRKLFDQPKEPTATETASN